MPRRRASVTPRASATPAAPTSRSAQPSPVVEFSVFGPVEIPLEPTRSGNHRLRADAAQCLAKELANRYPGHDFWEKSGVYLFGLRQSRGIMPWYVGKAGKESLLDEALNPRNWTNYQRVLDNHERGTPVLFFVAKPGKGQHVVAKNMLKELEKEFIRAAFEKNPEIVNSHHAGLPDYSVAGIPHIGRGGGRGKPTTEAAALRRALDL